MVKAMLSREHRNKKARKLRWREYEYFEPFYI